MMYAHAAIACMAVVVFGLGFITGMAIHKLARTPDDDLPAPLSYASSQVVFSRANIDSCAIFPPNKHSDPALLVPHDWIPNAIQSEILPDYDATGMTVVPLCHNRPESAK